MPSRDPARRQAARAATEPSNKLPAAVLSRPDLVEAGARWGWAAADRGLGKRASLSASTQSSIQALRDGMEAFTMPVTQGVRTTFDLQAAGVSLRTRAIHGGEERDPSTGAILTPIYQSTAFAQDAVGVNKGYSYSRVSNPTVSALERALGALEGTPPAVAFNTGLSATTTLLLTLAQAGDEVVLGDVIYGGTTRLLQRILSQFGVVGRFVDTSDPGAVARAINERTKLVFVESPANPTLKLTDIRAVARVARAAGVPLVVDNTFLTAVIQRPIELGADIVLYSTTKYIDGHNSTVGGAVVSQDEEFLEKLRFLRKALGTIQSPFEAWLTLRGLKTLPLRIREQSRNALTIAKFLQAHPAVTKVNYPGLSAFPQAELAQRQHHDASTGSALHGGIISFEVVGGYEGGVRVLNSVKLATLAENLGSVETLVTHSASMTHADVPADQRRAAGISDGLIRLSVGLEDPLDIIGDLDQALEEALALVAEQVREEVAVA